MDNTPDDTGETVTYKYPTRSRKRRRPMENKDDAEPPSKKKRLNMKGKDNGASSVEKNGRLTQMSGYCEVCTNPKELISCIQCWRSYHWKCFQKQYLSEQEILEIESMEEHKDMQDKTSDNENHMQQIMPPSATVLNHSHSERMPLQPIPSHACNHNHSHSHSHNHTSSIEESQPMANTDERYVSPSPEAPQTSNEDDQDAVMTDKATMNALREEEEEKLIEENMEQLKLEMESTSGRLPLPIKLVHRPRSISRRGIDSTGCIEHVIPEDFPANLEEHEAIQGWFRRYAMNITQRLKLLEEKPFLFGEKEIVFGFRCHECVTDTHSCFYCKKNEKNSESKPQKCRRCPLRFHVKCIDKYGHRKYTRFYQRTGDFLCPRHRCAVCIDAPLVKPKTSQIRRICWYCPLTACRTHAPHGSELVAAQLTHGVKDYHKYPDFKFDMLNCRPGQDDLHPSTQDLQFGRDDSAHGFINNIHFGLDPGNAWKLNTNAFNENFRLDNQCLDGFEEAEKKLLQQRAKNPWPKGFRKLTKSRWTQAASTFRKKTRNASDFVDKCLCGKDGCQIGLCYNATIQVECNDAICSGKKNCENRQFTKLDPKENIYVGPTSNRGFGAFAGRSFEANELVVEYVGEVITNEESEARLKKMNEARAPNFYFLQFTSKLVVDAAHMGNEARFMNHSCEPNCRTAIWDVNGEQRIGIFTKVPVNQGDEFQYDYQYAVKNANVASPDNLARCRCGKPGCRKFLGFTKKMAEEYSRQKKERKEKREEKRKAKKERKKEKKRQKKLQKLKEEEEKQKALMAHNQQPAEAPQVPVPQPESQPQPQPQASTMQANADMIAAIQEAQAGVVVNSVQNTDTVVSSSNSTVSNQSPPQQEKPPMPDVFAEEANVSLVLPDLSAISIADPSKDEGLVMAKSMNIDMDVNVDMGSVAPKTDLANNDSSESKTVETEVPGLEDAEDLKNLCHA